MVFMEKITNLLQELDSIDLNEHPLPYSSSPYLIQNHNSDKKHIFGQYICDANNSMILITTNPDIFPALHARKKALADNKNRINNELHSFQEDFEAEENDPEGYLCNPYPEPWRVEYKNDNFEQPYWYDANGKLIFTITDKKVLQFINYITFINDKLVEEIGDLRKRLKRINKLERRLKRIHKLAWPVQGNKELSI